MEQSGDQVGRGVGVGVEDGFSRRMEEEDGRWRVGCKDEGKG